MSFLKRHKAAVALVAVLGLSAGAYSLCEVICPGTSCPLAGTDLCPNLLSASVAYAGPGCSKSASGVCDADSKTKATTASATSVEGKTCSKEDCVKAIMAEKKVNREEAEAIYANAVSSGSCHGAAKAGAFAATAGCSSEKSSAQTASASGCTAHATNASFANATESKTCGDKEACIAKCMAEKGYTRAQAEECYSKCQAEKTKAIQANVITGSSYTREAWIDAKVASGATRAEAEVAAAKAEASGEVKFVTAVQSVGSSGCASTTKASGSSSCCAAKAKAATAEVKTEEVKPAASTASANAPSGGNK